MYGCTTLVADPVNVGVETVPAGVPAETASLEPESVWAEGCVTEWVRMALGPVVVPVTTPPAGFCVAAVMPVVADAVVRVALVCVPDMEVSTV